MFAFDQWADWLKPKGEALANSGAAVSYVDTRIHPECQYNPAFGLDIETPHRLATIRFWQNGLCDFEVVDISTEKWLAREFMLDANDQTVPGLLERFMSFLGT